MCKLRPSNGLCRIMARSRGDERLCFGCNYPCDAEAESLASDRYNDSSVQLFIRRTAFGGGVPADELFSAA